MNYKLLLPSYRQRYVFVEQLLKNYREQNGSAQKLLNLGTGEGDYDPLLAQYAHEVIACDINKADVGYAKTLNAGIPNLSYRIEDATRLTFEDDQFDLVVSTDVIEHVADAKAMMREVSRVLKSNGTAIITFPQVNFPWTYDPIHRLFGKRRKLISIGAYGYNHHQLIDESDFEVWAHDNGLIVQEKKYLTKSLVGLLELYWPGILQKIFKANSSNETLAKKGPVIRPSSKIPVLTKITDLVIKLDNTMFIKSKQSVGIGYLLKKEA